MARIGKIYIRISKIEDYIDILKKFGVDTSTYEERLKSILSDNESIIYGNIASEVLKHDTLSDLINLESDIIMNHSSEINLRKDYDSIHTKSLSLYNEISKTKDYDEAKLDLYIGEAKKTIDSVIKLDGISIEAYKKLAESMR